MRARKTKSSPVPRFAYHGGKGKTLATKIVGLLPPFGRRFVEPFAGRGNVYFRVAQRLDYKEFWLNDRYTFRFFVAMMHSLEDSMEWALPDEDSRYDKKFYDFVRRKAEERLKKEKPRPEWGTGFDRIFRPAALPDGTKGWSVEQYPPLFVIECFLSYSGGTYMSDIRGASTKNVSREGFMKNVRLAHEIMQRMQPRLTNCDYKDVLVECGENDVVYLDPPYINRKVSAYSADTLNHAELVEILLRAKFKWALSEYPNDIYRPLTAKFGKPHEFSVPKDMGSIRNGKREDAVECLWKNF